MPYVQKITIQSRRHHEKQPAWYVDKDAVEMCCVLFRGIQRWVIGWNLLSCVKGVSWVCTVNVNANVTVNVNANSMASYCSLHKEITFWKTFCLGRRTGPGFVYNFMNGRAMGTVGLDPVLDKQVLKISTDG